MTTKAEALASVTIELAQLSDRLVEIENRFTDSEDDHTFDTLYVIIETMSDALTGAIWELTENASS